MKNHVAIIDIKNQLGCSLTRAREIMLFELPHIDISKPGAKKPTWRAKKRDFDKWLEGREYMSGREELAEFSRRYMR